MNKIIRVTVSLSTILLFAACGSLKKNAEATALAAEQTTDYRYSQSMEELEKGINQQMMTMNMLSFDGWIPMQPKNFIQTPAPRLMARNMKREPTKELW